MAKYIAKLVLQKCNTFKYYYIYLKNLKVILSKNANLSCLLILITKQLRSNNEQNEKSRFDSFSASLVSVSAHAVDISGGSSISYNAGNDGIQGNPWSMNDSLTFSWGGELDNGFTVDMSFLLDNSDGAVSQIFDNRTLAIGMGMQEL